MRAVEADSVALLVLRAPDITTFQGRARDLDDERTGRVDRLGIALDQDRVGSQAARLARSALITSVP